MIVFEQQIQQCNPNKNLNEFEYFLKNYVNFAIIVFAHTASYLMISLHPQLK